MTRATNGSDRNAKLFGKGCDAERACSYLTDHFFGQDRASVFFSTPFSRIASKARRFWLSTLVPHIRHVVGMGADKKVAGVYASGIVAAVTNKHPVGDVDAADNQRGAVRSDVRTALPANADSTVSFIVTVRGPQPAFIITPAINLGPKTYIKRLCHALNIVGNQLQRQGSVPHL